MAQSIIVAEGNTPSDAYQNSAHIPINQANNGQTNNGQTKNSEVNLTSISLFQNSFLAALISAIIWLAITYIIAI